MLAQGDVLDVQQLGVGPDTVPEGIRYVVVISHSCDIANGKEPMIELLPCHEIDSPEGTMTYAKNPRELHLDFNSNWYALKASEKILVAKELVPEHSKLFSFAAQEQLLPTWLAARYRRHALDNSINEILKKIHLKKIVDSYSKPLRMALIKSIYNEELQNHELFLYFVFDSDCDDCDEKMEEFSKKFEDVLNKHENCLITPYYVRDDDISLYEVEHAAVLYFDYLSFD
jgi:hypothetical protein